MGTVSVRYIVDDVAAAIDFYTAALGFTVELHPAPGFAMLGREGLRLLLNAPGAGGAGRAGAGDGDGPVPGGWNRFQLSFPDLDAALDRVRAAGAAPCSEVVHGAGGRQVLVADPSGNLVELFEPRGG